MRLLLWLPNKLGLHLVIKRNHIYFSHAFIKKAGSFPLSKLQRPKNSKKYLQPFNCYFNIVHFTAQRATIAVTHIQSKVKIYTGHWRNVLQAISFAFHQIKLNQQNVIYCPSLTSFNLFPITILTNFFRNFFNKS